MDEPPGRYDELKRKAMVLLRGDAVMADTIVRSAIAAGENAVSQGRDLPPGWLDQTIADRARSVLRHRG